MKKKFLFIIGLLLLLLPTQGRAQWMKAIATGDSEYLYSVIEVNDIAYGPGFLAVG